MKRIILVFLLFVCSSAFAAQEMGISWVRSTQHQAASNTAWSPVTGTCVINTLVMNVSNAGSSWIITIKSGDGTMTLWSGTAALGTTTILSLPVGITLPGGLTVTFSGTAGVADFYATYR